ncbi:type III-B CRISPR module RAMP protein Cmr4 [Candidatus Parcubacteria bacterium]|nr:MAG: type III-B CRISPR module RAMP protein Cmr4 [Candidatus Parcubacteria bacterium]
MYTIFQPFALVAITPVHPGAGAGLGVIDLPIQREKHTGYPKIEASGIKGVLKDCYRPSTPYDKNASGWHKLETVLGPKDGDRHDSAAGFMDARILFFPVKSVNGVFAWVTCQNVLDKFQSMLELAGLPLADADGPISLAAIGPNKIAADDAAIAVEVSARKDVVLDDQVLMDARKENDFSRFISWFADRFLSPDRLRHQRKGLRRQAVTVDDDLFSELVQQYTEIIARNSLSDETGTVEQGPWYEEYLPQETILYSLALAGKPTSENPPADMTDAAAVMKFLSDSWPPLIQLGGNATIGKGFLRLSLYLAPQPPNSPDDGERIPASAVDNSVEPGIEAQRGA